MNDLFICIVVWLGIGFTIFIIWAFTKIKSVSFDDSPIKKPPKELQIPSHLFHKCFSWDRYEYGRWMKVAKHLPNGWTSESPVPPKDRIQRFP